MNQENDMFPSGDEQEISPQQHVEDATGNSSRTRLYLIRHGELTTSHEWRYVGHMDVELNDNGVSQIRRLAQRLKTEKIDKIYSSDLKRTAQSAAIIGETADLAVDTCPEFREIKLGVWEGLTLKEIVDGFAEEFERRSKDLSGFRVEGGESFKDVQNRAVPRLMSCVKENMGRNILIVAHGGVNRVILCHALGLDLGNLVKIDQTYACLNIIDFFQDGPVVRLVNATF